MAEGYKVIETYHVVRTGDGAIHAYNTLHIRAPEPIEKAIVEWFQKKRRLK